MPHMANLPWVYMFLLSSMTLTIFMIMNNFTETSTTQEFEAENLSKDNKNKILQWGW